MAFIVADKVKETTTTIGTGTYTLDGAVDGFQSFAIIGDGNSTFYSVKWANPSLGNDWEVGIGTYTSSGTTLTRSVIASSNSNSAVNWGSGSKEIFVSDNADRSIWNLTSGVVFVDGAGQSSSLSLDRKQTISIPAGSMRPRSTNGCAPLTSSAGASNQPDLLYLAFDGAAAEYATIGWLYLPEGYDEGTIRAKFGWRRASGTGAANVIWGIRAIAVGDNTSPATNFGTGATITDAASTTTSNLMLSGYTTACTIGNTPAKGKIYMIEVYRDGANGSDTLNSVDAWLFAVVIEIGFDSWDDS